MATETFSDETRSFIHLNLMKGIGIKAVQTLLSVFGTAHRVIQATPAELKKIEHLSPAACEGLTRKQLYYPLERELELIQEHGCHVITLSDAAYPACLKEINDPPLLLYLRGDLTPEDALSISFVGTRRTLEYGRKVSYRLSYQLTQRGFTIVSGLARGVDTAAHRGALEAGGRTLAVLGNGLSRIYPPENEELATQVEASGALISEFPLAMEPMPSNFPRRNRIISGLTFGTVVVSAPNHSGALITARLAAEQGREVFAVPGEIFSHDSVGAHRLISEGAKLVTSVDDLLNELPRYLLDAVTPAASAPNPDALESEDPAAAIKPQPAPAAQAPVAVPPPPDLTPDQKAVFTAIEDPASHIDTIVRTTQLPISTVSSMLTILELKGHVQQLPGKMFAKSDK